MTVTIVGSQLGDEGKGALVDRWGGDADVVVRYQGGDNAGHTVVQDGEEYKLSLVPSGAVRDKVGLLGNGCVVNPRTLFEEIDGLRERGLDPDVRVAKRAHVIMPYHRRLDGIEEEAKSDSDLDAGTTGRGIGPTYEDKVGRRGIRVGDLLDPEVLRDRLEYVVPQKRAVVEDVYGLEAGEELDIEALFEEFAEVGERLAAEDMAVNAGEYLGARLDDGAELLFEGAQGTSIDIDHGIYPYVTSSNREKGGEFGTVTGRPRRIGWLDMPMLRHAARANGFTGLAVNHLDVLADLEELKVAHAYDLDGEELKSMPATTEEWGRCEPVLREFDTWEGTDWSAVAAEGYESLPGGAKEYLDYLSEELDAPVYAVGVGPDREETIELANPFDV